MDNQLTVFNNKEFKVEVIALDGEVYFNAKNVGEALELKPVSVRSAILEMDDDEFRKLKNSDFTKESPNVALNNFRKLHNTGETFLTEAGIYALVFRSRKPSAKAFSKWVRKEVLPTIRKTGKFEVTTNKTNSVLPTNFLEALKALVISEEEKLKLKEANQKQEMLIEKQKPKVDFFDTVSSTKKLYSIREAAKSLGFKNMGQNNLFEFLRLQKVLLNAYEPYQNQVNLGRFKVKIGQVTKGDKTRMTKKVMVTIKGMEYIRKLLIKNGYKRVSNFTISNV